MKTKTLIFSLLPLLLAGCASGHRQEIATFSPLELSTITPTSDRDQNRMYEGTAPGAPAPSAEDIKIGREIREMLMQDKRLSSRHCNVIATSRQGVVTLQGTVPTIEDKQKYSEQIGALPGVNRVENHIEVHWYRPD